MMYFYVLLIVNRQKGSLRNKLPRVRRGRSPEDPAPVKWEASYVTRDDTVTGETGVVIFGSLDRAADYAGMLIAEGVEISIVKASDDGIRKHAFGGDPDGVCIVDADWYHPPGLPVKVSKLVEWERTVEDTRGT
jgi:hypothetical protein